MKPRMTLLSALRSEGVRLRRSPIVALHAVLALALGAFAGLYFGLTPAWDPYLSTDAFFQMLGAGAPLLAGISCGLALDAEREAGNYANVLGAPSRRLALAAKLIVLLMLIALAAALAGAVFCCAMAACGRPTVGAGTLAEAVLVYTLGCVALYAITLAVALRFGRNAAIGLGTVGLIVAIASLGGLGNGLVTGTFSGAFAVGPALWVPFAWPARLASLCVEASTAGLAGVADGALLLPSLLAGLQEFIVTSASVGALLVCLGLLGANRFEDARRVGE